MTWVYKKKRDGTQKARLCVYVRPGLLAGSRCGLRPGLERHSPRVFAAHALLPRHQVEAPDATLGFRRRLPPGRAPRRRGCLLLHALRLRGGPRLLQPLRCQHGAAHRAADLRHGAQAGRRWQRTIFPYPLRQGFTVSPIPTPGCSSDARLSRPRMARARRP